MNNRAKHEDPLTRPDDHCELAVAHVFTLAAPCEHFRVVGDAHSEIQLGEHQILHKEIRPVSPDSETARLISVIGSREKGRISDEG